MSDQEEEGTLASRRGRRSTNAKQLGKLAALEALRATREKGEKNKYKVKELDNVYDVVDEDTYARTVNGRLQDDWIVDDGTGYCETGHELFDDDLIDDDDYGGGAGSKKRNNRDQKKKKDNKQSKEEKQNQKQNFLSVRDMLVNMPQKKDPKKKGESSGAASSSSAANGGDDDYLNDLLKELDDKKPQNKSFKAGGFKAPVSLEPTRLIPGRLGGGDEASASMSKRKRDNADFSFLNDEPSTSKKVEKTPFLKKLKIAPEQVRETVVVDLDSDMGMGDMLMDMEPLPVPPPSKKSMPNSEINTAQEDAFLADIEMPAVPEVKIKEEKKTPPRKKTESIMTYQPAAELKMEDIKPECEAVEEGEEASDGPTLNFYWYDIYEEPKNPGLLYLFGKVGKQGAINGYVSCCLVVQNVQRWVYFLPREKSRDDDEDVSMVALFDEVEKVLKKHKISQFRSRKVNKKYCFGDNDEVPSSSEYMEVAYPGSIPQLPEDLSGNTFSHVFGTNSSMLENFVLMKQFKGPCWLQIKNPVQVDSSQQQSWCKMEFTCNVKDIQIHPQKQNMSIPPFVVASLNINSVNDAASKKDTIICLSVVINKIFKIHSAMSEKEGLFHESFCLLHKPPGEIWPFDVDRVLTKGATKMDSERSMLACFLAKLQQFDPDIYVGHDLNFDLLLHQLWQHKVPHWSRIGRLKRSSQPTMRGGKVPDTKAAIAGRMACDVKISAMELIRARSYDLTSLAMQVLSLTEEQVPSYTGAELRQCFEASEGIQHLITWAMSMAVVNLRLVNELQVMPLALQITTIAGNTMSRTLLGGRSERNEFLLLHAFYNKGYIVPEKQSFKKKMDIKKEKEELEKKGGKSSGPAYAGGLVLDPKKGFYDNFIVLMDFNSLYPSIIQEFNVCFTTSTTPDYTDESERGILPEQIRFLVESRKSVKNLMKDENITQEQRRQYDIRQMALKLTANSMYGCLGFQHSRFYAMRLAALITGKGREILLKTKDAVEKMGFEVIYGDTDSLMINTNSQDINKVNAIGNKIKQEINRVYRLLELDIDGVYRFLLLLKKKKYAALTYKVKANGQVETALELKGLDIVRRDWAPVAATTARAVLEEIMTEQTLDDKVFKIVKILNEKAKELRDGVVPLKDLLITKQLAKNPEEYKEKGSLYHVQVALRMNASGKLPRKFRNGDTVPYLFCTDRQPHHPVELMEQQVDKKEEEHENDKDKEKEPLKTLEPDPSYYLADQLHPVVSRICEPFAELDGSRIAEALGLDPSGYKKRQRHYEPNEHEDITLGEMSLTDLYRECERFTFPCPSKCGSMIALDPVEAQVSPMVFINGQFTFALSKCPGCQVSLYECKVYIKNRLSLFIRKFIEKYYKGWFQCEDPACSNRERGTNLTVEGGYFICPCKQGVMVREYTESNLNTQLHYLLYALDIDSRWEELKDKPPSIMEKDGEVLYRNVVEPHYSYLRAVVQKQLSRSAYSTVNMSQLFGPLFPKKFAFAKNNERH